MAGGRWAPRSRVRPVIKVGHPVWKGRADPGRGLDRVGELGGVGGGERDHGGGAEVLLGHLHADGGMGAEKLARLGQRAADGGGGLLFRGAARGVDLAQASIAPWLMAKPPVFSSAMSCATAPPSRP
jgi:hypothetical protein